MSLKDAHTSSTQRKPPWVLPLVCVHGTLHSVPCRIDHTRQLRLRHCANRSPFFIDTSSPQQDLIDPAVKGTQNVMRAAAKAKDTLKRLILTSSVAGTSLLPVSVAAEEKVHAEGVHALQLCMASMRHLQSTAGCTRKRTGTRPPALRTGRPTT